MLILSLDDSYNSLADVHLKTNRLWKEKMGRSVKRWNFTIIAYFFQSRINLRENRNQPRANLTAKTRKALPLTWKGFSCFGVPRGIRPLRHPHHVGSCVDSPTLADVAILSVLQCMDCRILLVILRIDCVVTSAV